MPHKKNIAQRTIETSKHHSPWYLTSEFVKHIQHAKHVPPSVPPQRAKRQHGPCLFGLSVPGPSFVEGRNFVLHGFGPNPVLLFHQLRRKEGLQVARYLANLRR